MRTVAAVALAAVVAIIGCGPAVTHLDVQNRTTVPVILWVGAGDAGTREIAPIVPPCEGVAFTWQGTWVADAPSASAAPAGDDAVRVRIPSALTPPPDGAGTAAVSMVIAVDGVSGYGASRTPPPLPPCEGRPPGT